MVILFHRQCPSNSDKIIKPVVGMDSLIHMASSTQGSSIPVNNPDESIGTATPTTVESIATATVTATPFQVEVSKPPKASGKKQSDC
ncbi:hypothetical protein C5167_030229 [Papaver somniferum]|nr:hypothetical protein C5167_030229 [Papaver somniferum]